MKKLILAISIGLFFFSTEESKAQSDIHFSQYNAAPLTINPANAGLFSGNFRVIGNYRRQWETVGTVYQTIGVSADMLLASDVFDDDFFGLGVSFAQDQSGVTGFTQLDGAVTGSYTKILDPRGEHYLTLGAQLGYGQRSVTLNGMNWDNQWTNTGFNQGLPSGETFTNFSTNFLDVSAGVNYFFTTNYDNLKGNFGVGAFHLNRPDVTIQGEKEELYVRYAVNGGLFYYLEDRNIGIYPNFLWMAQGPQRMLNAGVDLKFVLSEPTRYTGYKKETALSLGIYHRFNDAFFPMLKLSTGGFTLGLSYDMMVSSLQSASGGTGGPEFSLIYRTGYKSGAKSQPKNAKFY